MVARTATSRLAALVVLLGVSVAVRAADGAQASLSDLRDQVDQRRIEGQYQAAAQLAEQLVAQAERSPSLEPAIMALCRDKLAECYVDLGRLADAERVLLEARTFWEKAGPEESFFVAENLSRLGEVYRRRGRYADAEPLITEALRLRRQCVPRDPFPPATLLALRELSSLLALGELYRAQGRLGEARQQIEAALEIAERNAKTLGFHRARCLASLGLLCYDEWYQTRRDADSQRAEQYYGQALEAFANRGLANHVNRAECLNNLGRLYYEQSRRNEAADRWDDARRTYQEALAIFSQDPRRARARIIDTLNNLALLEHDRGNLLQAEGYLQKADQQLGDGIAAVPLEFQYNTHYVRAKVDWAASRHPKALDELRRAMDLAAEQRTLASGAAHERAQYFTQLTNAFERMVQWQASPQQGEDPQRFEQAYQAMERSRAMSLLDQMRIENVELWKAADGGRRSQLQAKIAQVEHELAKQPTGSELNDLVKQWDDARQQLLRELWDRSAAGRAVGDPRQGVSWAKLRAWTARQKALLLEYLIGEAGSYVLVVPADGPPSLETLVVGEKEAKYFRIDPGPLTDRRLQHLLEDGQSGVMDPLRSAGDPVRLVQGLHALWNVLVPPGARKQLLEKRCHHAVVVPDGMLNQLPFEVLVTLPSDPPTHLLESGPPLAYAPSATVLMSLVEAESPQAGTRSLLTLGGCEYWKPVVKPEAVALPGRDPPTVVQPGKLKLAFSATESDWVVEAFKGVGWETAQYKGPQATEKAFRTAMLRSPRLLHLSCHGEADQSYGNLFGMLLFTPSREDNPSPEDDGTLWLDDVYQLRLQGCELVLLSACVTNFGPAQRGEGMWALSRGFLVAGARRVIASNWNLDDDAGATLVSYLCGIVADAEKAGKTADYALALHQAKLWVHQQEKWRSPHFWGALVLVGPN